MSRIRDKRFPGLTPCFDRHGVRRFKVRRKGKHLGYVHGEYGSPEFIEAYEGLVAGESPAKKSHSKTEHGTIDWLVEQYMRTPDFIGIGEVYKKNLMGELNRLRVEHGAKRIATLERRHVESMMAKKAETPAAANKLLKLIGRLSRYAIRLEAIDKDPTKGIKPFKSANGGTGYHTWTDAEIAQFEDFHGEGSLAVLALRLGLYAGAPRQDVSMLGRQHIKGNRIVYQRHKTQERVDLPIHPDLAEAISAVPSDRMIFVAKSNGVAYQATSLGNWFRARCREAGLPQCSLHGLRKAGATRLAEAGATEFEIAAFLGHKSTNEARTYTKSASRGKLGDSAFKKLENVSNPVERLDKHRRN